MSPVDFAISTIGRAIGSFHPASAPRLSRAMFRRELWAWSLLPVALGAVEGGVAGVIAKNVFEGHVSTAALNLAVALLQGAPAVANILSFIWAAASHGRHKIRTINLLQVGTVACIAAIAFAPMSDVGLAVFLCGVLGARVCWSGVNIIRSTVWRANYPRHARARLAGKLAAIQAIVMAGSAYAIGQAMNFDHDSLRIAYPLAALVGLGGVAIYRGLRVRGHRAIINAERSSRRDRASTLNPFGIGRVLRDDRRFRAYMTCMFIFGFGNLMVGAPLIITMKDRFGLDESGSVAIITTIPYLLMPLTIPFWSRLLDRMHIVRFRAIHAWSFIASTAAVFAAALTLEVSLLYIAAVLKGIAVGGGVLGWNLGHHDFAPIERASQYMGVHVTLTGIRGITAPVLAVLTYQWLVWALPGESVANPGGGGAWIFAISLAISVAGAIGFVILSRRMPSTNRRSAADSDR